MRADYYNTLKTQLESISEIKHVGRWKNQINENAVNPTPCIYIEIAPVTYDSDTAKQQSAVNVEVILHLVTKKYTTEDTQDSTIYDLSQKIFNILHNTDGFSRLNESLDVTYDSLEDFQLTYLIDRLVDEDAMKDYSEIDRPTPDFINEMKEPDGS